MKKNKLIVIQRPGLYWNNIKKAGGGLSNGSNLEKAMDLANTAVDHIGQAVNMGTSVNDEAKAIKEDIKGNLVTPKNVTSTTDLLNQWSAFNPIQHITWRDLTNKGNAGSFIMDSLSMGAQGAASGSKLDPIGSIVGGVGGTLAGIFGNVAANVQAKKQAKGINRFIDSYNLASQRSFNTAAEELEDTMVQNDLRNFTGWQAAYGGSLNRNNSNLYKDGGPVFNPYTKTWHFSNGNVMKKRQWNKKYGYTLYTDDGFAVNYNHKGREIGRKKGSQTPSIKGNSRNKREQKYFDIDKEFTDSVKVISKRYGLNPNLVASRMAREGVDVAIDDYNTSGGDLLTDWNDSYYREGPLWGLDHFASEVESGRTTIKEPWVTYQEYPYVNEKGEKTRSAVFDKWSDAISGTAAQLSAIRGRLAKKYPNLNSTQLDAATSAAFHRGEGGVNEKIKDGSYLDYKPFIKLKAMGGDLMTHGANFNTGVILIDNGGTHEENPYEGVQVGVDDQGVPNLVEEGEVIFNDYVFSNRLQVPKYARKKYRLGGPLSFAQAALKMSKESEERPNDPISQTGLQDSMYKLMIEQEQIRNKQQSTMQGNRFDQGGNKKGVAPLTFQKYLDLLDSVNKDYKKFRKLLRDYNFNYDLMYEDKDKKYFKEDYELKPVTKGIEVVSAPYVSDRHILKWQPETDAVKLGNIKEPKPGAEDNQSDIEPLVKINTSLIKNPINDNNKQSNNKLQDYLRKAPIISQGIQHLQDLFGLSNRPDFNLGRQIRQANNQIPNVSTRPAGYKRFYKPIDQYAAINDFNAQMAAQRSAIKNAGNRVQSTGNQLASAYNQNLALGQLYAGMEDTNWKRLGEVISHNTQVDQADRDAGLNVASINANLGNNRANNLITAAKADADEEQAYATARATNRDNFYNSLGELGKERINMKMMQGLLESNIFGTPNKSLLEALNYMGINPSRAKGGKINRRKKKGLTY